MFDSRAWYYENIQNTEEDFYRKLPITTLECMYLPVVPKDVSDILEVKWKGRGGNAISAMDAFQNEKCIPIIQINMKKYNISEEYPYHIAHKEVSFFIETARELKNEEKS